MNTKNLYFLLLSTFLSCVFLQDLHAQLGSSITIFSKDGEKFWVVVNGVKQNDKPATQVKVRDLMMPNAMFKIIFEDEQIPSIDRNLMLRDADNKPFDISYVIRRNKKGEMIMAMSSVAEVSQSTSSSFPANTTDVTYRTNESIPNTNRPPAGQVTTTTISTTTTTKTTTHVGNAPETSGVSLQFNDGMGGNVDVRMNMDVKDLNQSINITESQTSTTQSSKTQISSPSENTAVTNQSAASKLCSLPVAQGNFETFKNSVRNTSFSESKEKLAKDFLRKNCVSAQQVKELVSLFSFEESKLNIAKAAYDSCVDKNNYFIVADAFSFSSSKEELMEYISSR